MNTFQIISPINGSVYQTRNYADGEAIEKTLARAKSAQAKWKRTSVADRIAVCQLALQYFLENAEEIAMELTWQMGRPISYTPFEIKGGFKERAAFMMNIAIQTLDNVQVNEKVGLRRFIKREPLGTVLVLAPWNYPYLTSVNAVFPALLAGNTVVLKHSDQAALCAERYAKAFEAAGLPEGVFQYLHITHEQVAAVVQDKRIDHVSFTGSVEGGKAVRTAIKERFIGCGLELGGKDPAYVRQDADIDKAVENLVDGAFFNSGQSCCGVERIYVHQNIFNEFVDKFVALTKQYVLGNPLDGATTLGPMVRLSNAAAARKGIAEAVKQGAKTLIDPTLFPLSIKGTAYVAPQVLVNVDHKMTFMQEESFSPTVGIMPVKNDEEAIFLMNDSRYGLTASVWTRDIDKAMELGEQIETGTFFMNRCDYLDPALAWTGVKDSGQGCTLSVLGFEQLTRPKSFHLRM